MGKKQKLLIDLKGAMKSRDTSRVLVLRSLVASIRNGEIEKKSELSAEEESKIIGKEAKKRKDAIEMYKKANRGELVSKEEAELLIIEDYLPSQMSEEEVLKVVQEMKNGGELDEDFGKSMKLVMAKLAGRADGRVVSGAVSKLL